MKRDELFKNRDTVDGDFVFDVQVAEVFDDMLIRSIPFYREQQRMVLELASSFWIPSTDIYDLGCSTATTLLNLCQDITPPSLCIGYDNSKPILDKAVEKITLQGMIDKVEVRFGDLAGDLSKLELKNASVVIMCWTLQFIPPSNRDALIQWISRGLVMGGILIVTEKIIAKSPQLNQLYIDLYNKYKMHKGYSIEEVLNKERSLRNVLIPYREDVNSELFRRNGFDTVDVFFRWFSFAGFLCIKG
jgi:tRNA (cmo5U34)-methyltransferase